VAAALTAIVEETTDDGSDAPTHGVLVGLYRGCQIVPS
jgi:hypothetical protein